MFAGRAFIGSFSALMNIAAVAAFPFHLAKPFKGSAQFNVGCQFEVAGFVCFFSDTYFQPGLCNFIKALFFGNFGKFWIELIPFFIFSGSCM